MKLIIYYSILHASDIYGYVCIFFIFIFHHIKKFIYFFWLFFYAKNSHYFHFLKMQKLNSTNQSKNSCIGIAKSRSLVSWVHHLQIKNKKRTDVVNEVWISYWREINTEWQKVMTQNAERNRGLHINAQHNIHKVRNF